MPSGKEDYKILFTIAALNGRYSTLDHLYQYLTKKPSSGQLFSTVPSYSPCALPVLSNFLPSHPLGPVLPTALSACLAAKRPHSHVRFPFTASTTLIRQSQRA